VLLGAAALAIVIIAGVSTSLLTHPAGPASTRRPPLAKNFSLPRLGHPGATVSLAAYAGRPVIVNFFASWCSPCQHETPLIARFYAAQHGRVIVLGIDANDEPAPALRFLHKMGVRYPVGSDPLPAAVTTSYGVLALPQTFFLNASHHVVSHVVGPVTSKELASWVARVASQSRLTAAATHQERG
jgi:cytochrome c biogenesis protein CcmG/thiol:disulfide interchange protein DsbE